METTALIEASPETHVMANALLAYTREKIPHGILEPEVNHIVISSAHGTAPHSAGKGHPFDGRHPALTPIGGGGVRLECFPSRNLCFHYASLIATFLALNKRRDSVSIQLLLPEPSLTERVLRNSNLRRLGPVHIAIIGHVHHLEGLCDGQWEGDMDESSHENIFRWKKFKTPAGRSVALIGCLEKLWGDASQHLVKVLAQLSQVQRVVYIAKAGALNERYSSNEWIATGETAFLDGEQITWHSPLTKALEISNKVASGPVATVTTTLCEDKGWLRDWSPRATWVDCEIGYIAKASNELGISFGFLHIVSDNLCTVGGEDLSNEDSDHVVQKRILLYNEIVRILDAFLSRESDLPS